MALIVEDGSIVANADAFVSVATFKTYADSVGFDYSAYTDTQIEQAIRRATAYLTWGIGWKGYKTKNRAQSLSWPRYDVVDDKGFPIPFTQVPVEVITATNYLTTLELQTPGMFSPVYVAANSRVIMERAGDTAFQYSRAPLGPESVRPIPLFLQAVIGDLLCDNLGSLVAEAVRR